MRFEDISLPEVYKDSEDFRFFVDWINQSLAKHKYDTENLSDIYDPLKCPAELLWMLGDTIGYKYDDRLPTSFNRLVILYFMQMIRKKGCKDGITFAAELNLAQFNLISYGAGYEDQNGNIIEGKDILYNRLEDTSVPVNAVYVTSHTAEGYIDVVYYSTEKPIDACIEYVRPVGMFLFQNAGVNFDARTQISIDARLTNMNELGESLGPTYTAHYTRDDYARLQKVDDLKDTEVTTSSSLHFDTNDTRKPTYERNSKFEGITTEKTNPGYRSLYSLQLCNNEHVVKSLIDPIFSLGLGPTKEGQTYSDEPYYITENDVKVVNPKSYLVPPYNEKPVNNLRYDRAMELSITPDVSTYDETGDVGTTTKPTVAINPIMHTVGDAIEIDDSKHTKIDED